ncbi:hypothetical protein D3C72_1636570 [compost metagenome]
MLPDQVGAASALAALLRVRRSSVGMAWALARTCPSQRWVEAADALLSVTVTRSPSTDSLAVVPSCWVRLDSSCWRACAVVKVVADCSWRASLCSDSMRARSASSRACSAGAVRQACSTGAMANHHSRAIRTTAAARDTPRRSRASSATQRWRSCPMAVWVLVAALRAGMGALFLMAGPPRGSPTGRFACRRASPGPAAWCGRHQSHRWAGHAGAIRCCCIRCPMV